MASTSPSFWRMVWEQRVHVIVMITNLIEQVMMMTMMKMMAMVIMVVVVMMVSNYQHDKEDHDQGKRKCDQYWPESGSQVFGLIDVLMLREEVNLVIIIDIVIVITNFIVIVIPYKPQSPSTLKSSF